MLFRSMLISETEYKHQVETDIRPFHDVLLGLFFISVGMALNPGPRQFTWLKAVIFVASLLPLARMVWLTLSGQLVEPLQFITRATGDWTLYFLCITLAVTPLRRFSKWNWVVKLRWALPVKLSTRRMHEQDRSCH